MKLAPTNFPQKAVVEYTPHRFELGDINDKRALIIRVEKDYIHDVTNYNIVLDGTYQRRDPTFALKNTGDKLQKFTVNSDGTISSDKNPEYALGTDEDQDRILWVHRSDKNVFIFENAQEILKVTETHGKKEQQQNIKLLKSVPSNPQKQGLKS